jgi:hypothetical protein
VRINETRGDREAGTIDDTRSIGRLYPSNFDDAIATHQHLARRGWRASSV